MRKYALIAAALLASAAPSFGQSCSVSISSATQQSCNDLARAGEILQARDGIGLAGGNPVPGASSTLGMRIGSVPRVSLALRVTGVGLDMPGVQDSNFTALGHSVNVDAAVGLFSGLTIAPTIGGFASIDLIGSAGKLSLPGSHGLNQNPGSWALGARLGILRESFTAPGISVTGMYRHIGDVGSQSNPIPSGGSREFSVTNSSALSVRAVVGKRLFVVGANAGIGYDSYRSDFTARAVGIGPLPTTSTYTANGQKNGHMTAFANATWTMLILNFVAEGGYQKDPNKNGYYGSLAVRLAL